MQTNHCDFNLDDFAVDIDDMETVDIDDMKPFDLEALGNFNIEEMNMKSIESTIAAKRLNVHPTTVRRMYHAGVLKGFTTGPSKTRIRIFEESLLQHMQLNEQYEQGQ